MTNVLAIAVHPDDETLGCGATLLKHAAAAEAIHWLIVTAATEADFTVRQIEVQRSQVEAVQAAYRFSSVHWLKLPTTRLEQLPVNDLIGAIRAVLNDVRPEIVYVPNRSDVHSDHRIVSDAASAVLKSFYMSSLGVRRVLACEVPSETDAVPALPELAFVPNVYVDVSQTLRRKLEIMSLFASEVQAGWMPRGLSALEALARHRGAAIGREFAEAFMLMREIA